MKKLLLDECIPRKFKSHLSGYDCLTVPEAGWAGKKNGELLDLAQNAGFQVFVSLDQGIEFQQNLTGRSIAVILLRAKSNRLADLIPLADNGVGDDAWCEEEFEEEEADEEEDEQEEGESEQEVGEADSEDEENPEEKGEKEEKDEAKDSSEEEDEPARPSRKPVCVARAARPERAERPASRRQPGANENAIVAEIDEDAVARHLLAALDCRSPHLSDNGNVEL